MEARIKAIDNYIERHDLKWTQLRLIDGSCKWRHFEDKVKHDEANLFKNWPTERILDSMNEEKFNEKK
jgi:hypothetical protein